FVFPFSEQKPHIRRLAAYGDAIIEALKPTLLPTEQSHYFTASFWFDRPQMLVVSVRNKPVSVVHRRPHSREIDGEDVNVFRGSDELQCFGGVSYTPPSARPREFGTAI